MEQEQETKTITTPTNFDQSENGRPTRSLVIGGCGFLGRHLVEKLLDLGHEVVVVDLQVTFEDARVTFFQVDINHVEDLRASMEGVDTVFHCATPNPLANDRKLFHRVIVEGTEHVIEACFRKKVKNLVLVSSAFVVFSGDPIVHGNEDLPYASGQKFSFYIEAKIKQEQLVLKADCDRLNTVALRPVGIFGPRDPNVMPGIARTAASSRGRLIIGDGHSLMDFVYVDNVTDALASAAQHLGPNSVLKGKAYNVSNEEPISFWQFVDEICAHLGYPSPKYHVSERFVYFLSVFEEFLSDLVRPVVRFTPLLTPLVVKTVSTSITFSSQRARRDFQYEPKVKLQEAIRRAVAATPRQFFASEATANEAHGDEKVE